MFQINFCDGKAEFSAAVTTHDPSEIIAIGIYGKHISSDWVIALELVWHNLSAQHKRVYTLWNLTNPVTICPLKIVILQELNRQFAMN